MQHKNEENSQKDEKRITKTHFKKCSTSFTISETQIETTF